jgi:hypothetical protein
MLSWHLKFDSTNKFLTILTQACMTDRWKYSENYRGRLGMCVWWKWSRGNETKRPKQAKKGEAGKVGHEL